MIFDEVAGDKPRELPIANCQSPILFLFVYVAFAHHKRQTDVASLTHQPLSTSFEDRTKPMYLLDKMTSLYIPSYRHNHCYYYLSLFKSKRKNKVERTSLVKQKTLAKAVSTKGIGLHTGVEVNLRLVPAPPDTGYVFIRTDLDNFEIPASAEFISHCSYATTLMRKGVSLSTVEHLLAALRGYGIDNLFIEVDNLELPIMDGSSEDFIDLIEKVGLIGQDEPRKALLIREKIEVTENNRYMSVEPAENYDIDCLIDFPHPLIGEQRYSVRLDDSAFGREIAAARTFGFTTEIEALRKVDLIKGGSLDNAIVLTNDGMLNQNPLRFANEFVRHKILDIVGDLALIGLPILGRVTAQRSGHIIHANLMAKLLKNRTAWEIIDYPQTSHNPDFEIETSSVLSIKA